ncbi:hypothetical protein JL09_g2971 [Pichia kudriavzevii]|uniref:allantoicase n=1 Tax=Pichia kudriavzevii TaxID=4909 RepID=A0A099P0R3_PICKU|nr:hypothetical protein JL09_g2971 [Pichia kudriavzevii]
MSVSAKQVDGEYFKANVVQKYTDIVGEKLGGRVLAFSDEWFAAAENLIKPKEPIRDATRFVYSGAWYDGWETRRHNTEECDWVIFQMGVSSAQLVGCEVDTAFFNGNHAPFISVEAANVSSDSDYRNAEWETIIPKFECGPSQKHFFVRDQITEKTYTHVKLNMYPDGGIARFRLYGKVVPIIPQDLSIQLDTASAIQGGVCIAVSDQHFGSADNLLLPGRGHDMSDGWETKRSRGENHIDWAIIRLGHKTNIKKVTVDTAHFRGNFPQYVKVEAIDSDVDPLVDDSKWETIVDKSKTSGDLEHDYTVTNDKSYTHIKLIMIPDGGVKRVRAWGTLTN